MGGIGFLLKASDLRPGSEISSTWPKTWNMTSPLGPNEPFESATSLRGETYEKCLGEEKALRYGVFLEAGVRRRWEGGVCCCGLGDCFGDFSWLKEDICLQKMIHGAKGYE